MNSVLNRSEEEINKKRKVFWSLNKLFPDRFCDGIGAAVDFQLVVNISDVRIYGMEANIKLDSNGFFGSSFGDQL